MATYTVDAALGSDGAGDGSPGAPWQTLTKALAVAGDGDTIRVRDGIYRGERLTIAQAGLTIEAEPGQAPIIAGSHTYSAWAKTAGYAAVYQTAVTAGGWFCFGAWRGGTLLRKVADPAACDAAEDSGVRGGTAYVHVAGGGAPGPIEIDEWGTTHWQVNGADVTLRGLTFQWLNQGLALNGARASVERCTFRYLGDWGGQAVLVNAAGCRILASEIQQVDRLLGAAGFYGIRSEAGCTGLLVAGCTLHDGEQGLQLYHGDGHEIRDCHFGRHNRLGIIVKAPGVTRVHDCVFHDIGHGCIRGEVGHSGTVHVYRNRMFFTDADNPAAAGIDGLYSGVHVHGSDSHWYVTNNVYAWGHKNLAGAGVGLFVGSEAGHPITVQGYNNAFYEAYCVAQVDATPAHVTLDYSAYDRIDTPFQGVIDGGTGTHNVTGAPGFVDAGAMDFRLAAGSPLRDAGVVVAGVTEGSAGAGPDIGWHERAAEGAARARLGLGLRLGLG